MRPNDELLLFHAQHDNSEILQDFNNPIAQHMKY